VIEKRLGVAEKNHLPHDAGCMNVGGVKGLDLDPRRASRPRIFFHFNQENKTLPILNSIKIMELSRLD
jgi:hypothetical protein